VHFEIHAADPMRARRFYEGLFGWTFTPLDFMNYSLIKTGEPGAPGIDGGLFTRIGPNPDAAAPTPVIAYVCTIEVEDLDGDIARTLDLGGSIAVAKAAIPGVGWLAYCKDTEANIFGMMQRDPAAA
jgi:predicted enzyme related to lactoylglutathione lyase